MPTYASTFYRRAVEKFAPAWFLETNGRALLRALGGAFDDMAERAFEGRRQANPYAAGSRTDGGVQRECDESMLAFHSRDRGIRIYDTEPTLSKRVRLGRFRQLKKQRGSHSGELYNLQPFWLAAASSILPTMRIVFQDNKGTPSAIWYTLHPSGRLSVYRKNVSNWNYDGQPTKRTRFWLIIHLPPGYSSATYYDDGVTVYDGGAIYDGITTIAIADIVAAVKEAKAAHSKLAAVIVTELQPNAAVPGGGGALVFDPTSTAATLPDGTTSLPTGNWGTVSDPVTGLPTRPTFASWLWEDNA